MRQKLCFAHRPPSSSSHLEIERGPKGRGKRKREEGLYEVLKAKEPPHSPKKPPRKK